MRGIEKNLLLEIVYALVITIVFGSIFMLTEGMVRRRVASPEAFDATPCDGVCLMELKCAEIYNDRLYAPEDFAQNRQEAPAEKPDYDHYLTYRFFVNTVPGEAYGFFSLKSDYAMNVFADGVLIAATGAVADDPQDFIPTAESPSGQFTAGSNKTEIIVQQANFNHRKHYNTAVMLGPARELGRYVRLFYTGRAVIVASLVTAGLMNLGMYLFFDRKRRYLFLVLLCVAGAVNYATPYLLISVFHDISWYVSHKIEYCSKILVAVFSVAFADTVFDGCLRKVLKRLYFAYASVCIALFILLPSVVYTRISDAGTYLLVALIILLMIDLSLHLKNRRSELEAYKKLILFGMGVIFVFSLVELVGFSGRTGNAIKTETGLVVFVFINTVALALDNRDTRRLLDEARLREEELRQTNATMVKLGNIRDTFLADLSHELKTPLTVIGNNAALAAYQMKNGLADEQTVNGLRKIENEAVRLGKMVDKLKLKSVAGFEKSGEKVRDLPATLRYAADFCDPLCRRNNNRITVACEEGLTAEISEDLVFHCLYNLIANATRHCRNNVIELKGTSDGAGTMMQVVDHGDGMTDAEKKLAFDRGWSGDAGSGIGLALCRQITEDNGGAIRLSDTPGGGLTVTITFNGGGHG